MNNENYKKAKKYVNKTEDAESEESDMAETYALALSVVGHKTVKDDTPDDVLRNMNRLIYQRSSDELSFKDKVFSVFDMEDTDSVNEVLDKLSLDDKSSVIELRNKAISSTLRLLEDDVKKFLDPLFIKKLEQKVDEFKLVSFSGESA